MNKQRFEIANKNTHWSFATIKRAEEKAKKTGDKKMLEMLAMVSKLKLEGSTRNDNLVQLNK